MGAHFGRYSNLSGYVLGVTPAPYQDDVFDRADTIAHKETRYIWHDRFMVGAINYLGGVEGKGKSQMTMLLSADVSQADAVILSNHEDARYVIRARLEAAGAKLDNVYVPRMPYRFPEDSAAFERDIVRLGAKLAVFDTSAQHFSVRLSDDQGLREALTPLTAIAEKHGVTLVFVGHTLRHITKRINPIHALQGPGLTRAARSICIFGVLPDGGPNERACVWVKDQGRESGEPKAMTFEIESYDYEFQFEGQEKRGVTSRLIVTGEDADFDPIQVMTGRTSDDDTPKADKREDAGGWLTIYLSTGEQPVRELRDHAAKQGHSWATIRRAAEDVGIEKLRRKAPGVPGFGKGTYLAWALPEDHPSLLTDDPNEDDGDELDALTPEESEDNDETTTSTDDLPMLTDEDEQDLEEFLGSFGATDNLPEA